MSYASVIGQQLISETKLQFDDSATANTLKTIYTQTLVGKFIYTVQFQITSTVDLDSVNIICGSTEIIEVSQSQFYTRTCTGIATGVFEIKVKFKEDVDYVIECSLLKLG